MSYSEENSPFRLTSTMHRQLSHSEPRIPTNPPKSCTRDLSWEAFDVWRSGSGSNSGYSLLPEFHVFPKQVIQVQEIPRVFSVEKIRNLIEFHTALSGGKPDFERFVRGIDIEIHGIVPDNHLSLARVDRYRNTLFLTYGPFGHVSKNESFRHFYPLFFQRVGDDFPESERMDFRFVPISQQHFQK